MRSAIQIVLLIILAYKSASEKIELSCSEEILHPSQDYPECFPETTCTLSTIYSVQDSAFNVDRVIAEYNCLIFHNSILHEIPKALFLTGKSNITIFYAENSNIIELNRTSLLNAPHLLEINLKGNKIRVLKDKIFYGAPNLEKLDLSYNEISEFSSDVFDKLKNLKVLHLSNNLITTIPFELFMPLTGIQHLNMRSNKLNIKFGIFPEYVVKLDLSYNYIDIHHKFKIFALLPNLETVLLHGNRIENLHRSIIEESKSLKFIGLSDNIFTCSTLADIIFLLDSKDIEHLHDTLVKNTSNVRGIRCIE